MSKAFWDGFWCGANLSVALSWLLWALGHGSYWLIEKWPNNRVVCAIFFRPYQLFMRWSLAVQGNSKCGPWSDEFREEIAE